MRRTVHNLEIWEKGGILKVQAKLHLDKSQAVQGLPGLDKHNGSWAQVTDKLLQTINSNSSAKLSSQPSGEYFAEMFKLQIQMNRLHMRVELCSKVAESASTSIKKLQQAQ